MEICGRGGGGYSPPRSGDIKVIWAGEDSISPYLLVG